MKQIQASPNPQLALQNLIMNNPNYRNIIDLMRMGGNNLQQIAQYLANQKGVNLNELIQELQR